MASSDNQPSAHGSTDQEEDTTNYDTKVTEARLTSPLGSGEPIEFDPDVHETALSDEEFDKLTLESGESSVP